MCYRYNLCKHAINPRDHGVGVRKTIPIIIIIIMIKNIIIFEPFIRLISRISTRVNGVVYMV